MSAAMADDVMIRDLSGMGEFRQSEALQVAVWGAGDTPDPADLMMVIQAEGGLCAGAFRDGVLLGYVFGFPTREGGVQHSHRLAVLPQARGLHLGTRLKWYQRSWCLARGITHVRWTFDPLRRINASLNVAALGAVSNTYHADYYGDMQGINAGLPSDRLLVDWYLDSPRVVAAAEGRSMSLAAEVERVGIPADFDALIQSDPSRALAERLRLRTALTRAFARGEAISGFDRVKGEYLLIADR